MSAELTGENSLHPEFFFLVQYFIYLFKYTLFLLKVLFIIKNFQYYSTNSINKDDNRFENNSENLSDDEDDGDSKKYDLKCNFAILAYVHIFILRL